MALKKINLEAVLFIALICIFNRRKHLLIV